MMKDLLWAESQKLHRSKILWIAGFATVMVGLIVFAQGQFTFYDRRYIDGAGWFMTAAQSLATFYVLPAVIALLGSYMICREEQEDTLKSLRLIPVDEVKLTLAKMILAFVFSVLIYLLLFAITFLVEAVLHLEALSVGLVLENLKIYFLDGVGVFFAISPIIALVARMKKGYWLALVFAEIYSFAGLFASMSQQLKTVYPMTAVFNISGYYNANMFQVLIGVVILMVCVILSLLILKGWNRKTICPSMLDCPPRHVQQLPDLTVTHIHEVGQQDHVALLPQELGQRRRKAVIVDGDAVSAHFKLHGVNVLGAKLRKKLRGQLRKVTLPRSAAHL